eukprot:TRINITY_DN601_c0_g1_i1.p1 TRINITY_DN601_c0_g1~~TRINITY_DN601_c0_g1_i1.p1  ORF type:complete len:198 (+),score=49.27 TRINITY_DN601_c0_g1_i1:56-595(+)
MCPPEECSPPEECNPELPAGVHWLHGLYPDAFLRRVDSVREEVAPSTESGNMVCDRYFFDSEEIAQAVQKALPPSLAVRRVLPAMRVLHYTQGGYIGAHTDGVMWDTLLERQSTHSFLLGIESCPDGGSTDFLNGDDEVVAEVQHRKGSILVFPHKVRHRGSGVGSTQKLLLRGDMVCD